MKIKFNRDYQVKAENGRFFEKDKTYDLSDGSCEHFLKRKVAVKVTSGAVSTPHVASDAMDESKESVTETSAAPSVNVNKPKKKGK